MFAFVCKFFSFCTGSQTAQGNFLWKKKGLQGGYLTLKFNDKVKIFETAVVISLLKWNFWSPISPKRLIFFQIFLTAEGPVSALCTTKISAHLEGVEFLLLLPLLLKIEVLRFWGVPKIFFSRNFGDLFFLKDNEDL